MGMVKRGGRGDYGKRSVSGEGKERSGEERSEGWGSPPLGSSIWEFWSVAREVKGDCELPYWKGIRKKGITNNYEECGEGCVKILSDSGVDKSMTALKT